MTTIRRFLPAALVTGVLALASCVDDGVDDEDTGTGVVVRGSLSSGGGSKAAGDIDAVLAADSSGMFIEGTVKSDGSFRVTLEPGKVYLLAFYEGTAFRYAFAYPTTGLESLPLNHAVGDVELGALTVSDGTKTAEPAADPAAVLGLSEGEISVIAPYDQMLWRFTNADVDGDGVFDFQQNRSYGLTLAFEFLSFELPETENQFFPGEAVAHRGYHFYGGLARDGVPADRDSDYQDGMGVPLAVLREPAPGFTGLASGAAPSVEDREDCGGGYFAQNTSTPTSTAPGYSYDFYWRDYIVEPASPPAGDYVIELQDGYRTGECVEGEDGTTTAMTPYPAEESGAGTWAIGYTFQNMPSPAAGEFEDAPRAFIRVDTADGAVVAVQYQWRKPGSGAFVDMTDEEVCAYTAWNNPGLEISTATDRFSSFIPACTASVTLTEFTDGSGNPASPPAWADVQSIRLLLPDFTGTTSALDIRSLSGMR